MSNIADRSQFPDISAFDLEDNQVNIADLTAGSWGLILFYRGHW